MKPAAPLNESFKTQTPSFWVAAAVVWTACVIGMAISPMSKMEWVIATLTDKTLHGLAFAVGTVVWANAFKGTSLSVAIPVLIGAGISLVLGGVIEILQHFVPGRSPDFEDVLADVIGIVAASFFLILKSQFVRNNTELK